MYTIDTNSPVLVTGATGYIGSWVIKRLLDAGVKVHAAVRDASDENKTAHLNAMAEELPGQIECFSCDLMQEESFAEAMQGCRTVFHIASPFFLDVKDAQKELVGPAIGGVRSVLNQASKTESVRRIVMTSSCAAIYGDNADVAQAPEGVLTEDCWNTTSSPTHNPYSYSKTVAEQEAWKLAEGQEWDLVVINPSLVLGPGINPQARSESYSFMCQIGDGTLRHGVPHWEFGVVDVRDVADAHISAAYTAEASGRYIISGHNVSFRDVVAPLIDRYGDAYPFPRRPIPKWLIWLIGPMVASYMTRRNIERNVGHRWQADNSKSKSGLGISYRPLEDTVTGLFEQLVEAGRIVTKG